MALLENEKQKTEDLENAHQQAMDCWLATIEPRQQVVIRWFNHDCIHFHRQTISSPHNNNTAFVDIRLRPVSERR